MKSIIEEATSVIKAVETAWNRAGNPEEFSIKVFELPHKNFFGITTKKAKIGIFFDEAGIIPVGTVQKEKKEPAAKKHQPVPAMQQTSSQSTQRPQKEVRKPVQRKTSQPVPAHPVQKEIVEQTVPQEKAEEQTTALVMDQWTPESAQAVEEWIKNSLSLLGLSEARYTTSMHGAVLQFIFTAPVMEDFSKERQLFRSFIYLIMAFLRNKYKADIRQLKLRLDHKVVDEKVSSS